MALSSPLYVIVNYRRRTRVSNQSESEGNVVINTANDSPKKLRFDFVSINCTQSFPTRIQNNS